jgi:hypothetical protein
MEGMLDDGVYPDPAETHEGDFNEGFVWYDRIVALDTEFSQLPECEVELPFRAETMTDPAVFDFGKIGTNISPGSLLKPECVRVRSDGALIFFFSMKEPVELSEAGWLYGADYNALIDIVPDTFTVLNYNFGRIFPDKITKIVKGNVASVGNRRRIADAMNNALSDRFAKRIEALRELRAQTVQEHYQKAEDAGMF